MTSSQSHPHDANRERKAVLYCPDCGHASPIDGDWRVGHTETDENVTYRCPDCGTLVTTRPDRDLAVA